MKSVTQYLLGVDLGGSSVKTVAVSREGLILEKRVFPFEQEIAGDWGTKIRLAISDYRRLFSQPAEAIGLSAPGIASQDERSIAVMPGRLSGLVGLDWTLFLEAPNNVRVLNDAHAALLGEVWLGAAKGRRNVAMITLGTGVGGALLLDGRLFRGHLGRAGHIGHLTVNHRGEPDITGMPGSLEDAIGNCTILNRSKGLYETTHGLLGAVARNEPQAVSIWNESLQALAVGIASVVNIVDPELFVIGGGIAAAGENLFGPLRRMVAKFEWKLAASGIELAAATQGEYAGACGAAAYAAGLV